METIIDTTTCALCGHAFTAHGQQAAAYCSVWCREGDALLAAMKAALIDGRDKIDQASDNASPQEGEYAEENAIRTQLVENCRHLAAVAYTAIRRLDGYWINWSSRAEDY